MKWIGQEALMSSSQKEREVTVYHYHREDVQINVTIKETVMNGERRQDR